MGMDHAGNRLDMADTEIPTLPFEEAVAFMKSRVPVTKTEWSALEPKLRFRAFTVARLAQLDYINAARQILYKALETGKGTAETYKQWQTLQTLAQDNTLQLRPGYWENVFRTNTQSAYVAGKLMQFQNDPPPAWRLLVIDDSRTSDICRGLLWEGKSDLVLAADHPFWKTFGFPPYHYQCRTGLQAVYKNQINHGVQVENPAMENLRERFAPMKGFGGNPIEKESWWKITEGMAARAEKYGVWADILQQAGDLDMISYQKELLKGYIPVFKGKNGGYVERAKNWEYSKKEMDAAEELANEGHQIYLLPRNRALKSADILIDNAIGEIKHQKKPTAGSISSEVKEAGRFQRARTIVLFVLNNTSFNNIQSGIWKSIHRTPVQTVILKWQGKTWTLPRSLLMNKDWELP
jgi:hypothetical protein